MTHGANARCLLVACLAFIGGCASSPQKQEQDRTEFLAEANAALASRESCCTRPADFSAAVTWPVAQRSFEIGNESPVGTFDGDKSYFLALQLPQALPSRRLVIRQRTVMPPPKSGPKTVLDSHPTEASGYILNPFVTYLDSSRRVLSVVNPPMCFGAGGKRELIGYFAATVAPVEAAYAIIHTATSEGKGVAHAYSGEYYGGKPGIVVPYSGTSLVHFGPGGHLALGVVTDEMLETLGKSEECRGVVATWSGR